MACMVCYGMHEGLNGECSRSWLAYDNLGDGIHTESSNTSESFSTDFNEIVSKCHDSGVLFASDN